MLSPGKKFEEQFKLSIPENVMYHRLPDQAQSFQKSAKYTHKNPCDEFLYKYPRFYAFELKSTNKRFMSVETCKAEEGKKMIHWHQREGLKKFNEYRGIISGFVLNFRDDEEKKDATYFIHIEDFERMMSELNKKSFTLLDLMGYNPIRIKSELKRVNFSYDVKGLLRELEDKYKVD